MIVIEWMAGHHVSDELENEAIRAAEAVLDAAGLDHGAAYQAYMRQTEQNYDLSGPALIFQEADTAAYNVLTENGKVAELGEHFIVIGR